MHRNDCHTCVYRGMAHFQYPCNYCKRTGDHVAHEDMEEPMQTIKDSGTRREFMEGKITDSGARINYGDHGAMREPALGKGRFELLSPFVTRRDAIWMELGAVKYADRNWEKGIPFGRTIDSALRHLNDWQRGLRTEDNLSAARWNIGAMVHYEETGMAPEWNNYPNYATSTLPARGYKIIAVDFDGTLCESAWPEIGAPKRNWIDRAIAERKRGSKLILWTCREGEKLDKAVEWCKQFGLEFDAVNENLQEQNELYGNDSRKIGADEYWDDKAVTAK